MKTIDRLLLKSFFGPFLVSFGVALFVLIMQFLWLYIDEIAGKGVSIFVMVELIAYMSISLFPMALPIAVLISSVMVVGNLAERYELSSMKSAGLSLLRIMRGLVFCATGVAIFSYVSSDFLLPLANLKFKSRLYDIRRQKPALSLEKGVFNEDFRQFVIRIGNKEDDGETIEQVLIQDETNAGRVKFNQIMADSGQMFTTADKRYFVMNLFNGTQYQEPGTQGQQQKQHFPFVRTNFKSYTKVWDMKEFEMTRSEDDRFKGQRSMLSMKQLRYNMDSLQRIIASSHQGIADEMLFNLKKTPVPPVKAKTAPVVVQPVTAKGGKPVATPPPPPPPPTPKFYKQEITKPLDQYGGYEEVFVPEDRIAILREAHARSGLAKSVVSNHKAQIETRLAEYTKTGYELYSKHSFALVCFFFLFIGAPMGAIIRKGGFGYPVLVSIVFFIGFIMLTIFCRKLAETYIMTPFWAALAPSLLMAPIGAFLTRKAMNDSQMISTDRIERLFGIVVKFIKNYRRPKQSD
jgi:lipopolysaccharide export system permease protein